MGCWPFMKIQSSFNMLVLLAKRIFLKTHYSQACIQEKPVPIQPILFCMWHLFLGPVAQQWWSSSCWSGLNIQFPPPSTPLLKAFCSEHILRFSGIEKKVVVCLWISAYDFKAGHLEVTSLSLIKAWYWNSWSSVFCNLFFFVCLFGTPLAEAGKHSLTCPSCNWWMIGRKYFWWP